MLKQILQTLCFCAVMSIVSCVPLLPFGNDNNRDNPTDPYYDVITYTNDSNEPNDNYYNATLFSKDSFTDLICIPGEYDYFKVPVDSNTQTVFYLKTIISSGSYGTISFTLYNRLVTSNIKSRSISVTSISSDSIVYFSPIKDTVILSVSKSYSYTPETKYILSKKVSPIQIADISEPNNSVQTASLVTDTLLSGFITSYTDTDYYKIPVLAGTNMVINLSIDSANTFSILTYCHSKSGALSITSDMDSYPSQSYTCYAKSGDTCLLRVYTPYTSYSSQLQMPGRYTITISKTKIKNDSFEPNQTPSEAKTIKTGRIDSLYLVGNEYDYYRLTFDTTTYVEALLRKLQSSTSSLNFSLERKGSLTTVPSSTSDSLKHTFIVNAHDTVYLRITNTAAISATSSLLYQLDIRTTSIFILDSIEPNDTKATARILKSSLKSVLIGQNDTDYYKIPVPKDTEIQIKVSGDSLSANYCASNLEVETPGRLNQSRSSYTTLYNYYTISGDTAVLKVFRPSGSTSSLLFTNYSITLTPTTIRDDRFELNDTTKGGTKLSTGIYDSLILVAADTDRYFFTSDTAVVVNTVLTSGFTVSSECYLTLTAQNALDNSATQLQTRSSTLNLRCFVAAGDTIFFQVTGYNKLLNRSSALGYSLSISEVTVSAVDTLEPNNTPAQATSLKNIYSLTSQLYSSSDTDYYSIPLYHEYFYRVRATGDSNKMIPVTFVVSDSKNKSASSGTSSYASISFDLRSNDTDSVYIKVYCQSAKQVNTSCNYTFAIETIKVIDDTFETNDTKATAYPVKPQKYDSLTAFLGNPDYYKIDIDSGTTLSVIANFSGSLPTFPAYASFALNFETADSIITSTSTESGSTLSHSYSFNKKETVFLKILYSSNILTGTYSHGYAMDVRVVAAGK